MDTNENALVNYLPTPAEIAAKCIEIQATWSPQERERRGGYVAADRWTAPQFTSGSDCYRRVG